jgi:hypothetical protein
MSAATIATAVQGVVVESPDEALVEPQPFLYSRREYVETVDGSTTVCSLSVSSPVKEFGPDD